MTISTPAPKRPFITAPGAAPALAILMAVALAGCGPSQNDSPEKTSWTPKRSTPAETIAGAIRAMEREEYSDFPAILSLTYKLYLLEHGAARQETEAMTEEDFARTLRLLRELREKKPRYTQGGNLAIFKVPGYKLPGDKFHLIRYGGKWYFLVE